MRRSFGRTIKGQPYCVEWPEWMIECAEDGCDGHALVAALGMAMTVREAEKLLRKHKTEEADDWSCHDGLWFCPKHNGNGK